MQVSYRKAVNRAANAIVRGYVAGERGNRIAPFEVADQMMREALSPAQRARLEARSC